MKFYAVINENNIVVEVKQIKSEIKEANYIEISSLNSVQCSEKYNPITEQFETVPIEPNSIISGIALWNKFFEVEQENLVDSPNKKIKRFLYELRIGSSFDLKDPKLINAINALEAATEIGVGRAAEILSC